VFFLGAPGVCRWVGGWSNFVGVGLLRLLLRNYVTRDRFTSSSSFFAASSQICSRGVRAPRKRSVWQIKPGSPIFSDGSLLRRSATPFAELPPWLLQRFYKRFRRPSSVSRSSVPVCAFIYHIRCLRPPTDLMCVCYLIQLSRCCPSALQERVCNLGLTMYSYDCPLSTLFRVTIVSLIMMQCYSWFLRVVGE